MLLLVIGACGEHPRFQMDAPGGDAVDAVRLTVDVSTTPNQWVWVPFAGTTCANGTPAGIGINRAPTAGGDLFIYFEGGGACWDTITCTNGAAVNLDVTYDAAKLATDVSGLVVDHASAPAPLDTTTYVFVPYCTGDLHDGTNVMAYPGGPTIHHTGGTNTQAFVDALAAGFHDAPELWVLGSSAGGYGATLNFERFTKAWPNAKVELLEDSSPFIPILVNYATLLTAWQLTLPPLCGTACQSSFTSVFDAVVAGHPTSRIALLTWDDDPVIKQYFAYTSSLVPVQADLIANHFDHPNTKVFEATGMNHTMFGQLGTVTSHGVKLGDWVNEWLLDLPTWATVTP